MDRRNALDIWESFMTHPAIVEYGLKSMFTDKSLGALEASGNSNFYQRVKRAGLIGDENRNKFSLRGVINNTRVGNHGSRLAKGLLGMWDSSGPISMWVLSRLARRDSDIAEVLRSCESTYSATGRLETYDANRNPTSVRPILIVPGITDRQRTMLDKWETRYTRDPRNMHGLASIGKPTN